MHELIQRLRQDAADLRHSAGKHGEWAVVHAMRGAAGDAHLDARNAARAANKALDLEAAADALEQASGVCKWTEDKWGDGMWETDCGESFCFIDDGPAENKVRFCCYCGKRLEPVPYVIPDEPDEDEAEVPRG